MVSRSQTTHASGGPATVGGVDYEIDCALADALELVEQHLVDPLCDGTIKPQARLGSQGALTGWDYGVEALTVVEVKRNATATDGAEWFERCVAAASSGGTFRLVFGEATGSWQTVLAKYVDLAKEADDDERLLELAANDRLTPPGWMKPLSVSLLRRMEVQRRDPSELARTLASRARVLFLGKPDVGLPVMRDRLRSAAHHRQTVRASELLDLVKAADVAPRHLQGSVPLDEQDARRVTLFLVSRCETGIPIEWLRAFLGESSAKLDEALASLKASGLTAVDEQSGAVSRRGTPPAMTPTNGPAILERTLRLQLSALETGASWAMQPLALRLSAELCMKADDISPQTTATAFKALDKDLKNLGDVGLVLRTAQACVVAAQKAPAGREMREGEAQALICGVSWAKQRTGRLDEARADATRSKEIGEALPWPRNTAFCGKCIGRLLRLEATTKPDAAERHRLLRESVRELLAAINEFGKVGEMTQANREEEQGACHSLLGRSFLELGRRREALEQIERAIELIPESRKKDIADLWILRGEFEHRWGSPEYARTAFAQALAETSGPGFEIAEMRARAFEQRAKVAESTRAALADLRQAREIFARLGDSDGAARAEFTQLQREGRVPKELEAGLEGVSSPVSVRAVHLAEARRRSRGSAVAYRDAIPARVVRELVDEARSQAVIEDGGASHVVTPRTPPRVRAKKSKQSLDTVCRRLVPEARDAEHAARMLAKEASGDAPEAPVKLEEIARRIGVDEIRAADLARNGELEIDDDGVRIVYSRALGKVRRRFTIAHELGHAVLICRGGALVRDGRNLERFCDTFASALLMPSAVLPALPAPVTAKDLMDVARRFEVSVQAAAIRLQKARGGFQAFCVEGTEVIWTAGELRPGRIAELPDTIRDLARTVLAGNDSPREVFANLQAYGGRWSVSLERRSGANRVFVVLSPSGPVVRARHYE